MIQRLLSVLVGALLTFLVLWLTTVAKPTDLMPWYLAAVGIGALATFLTPTVIGIWRRDRTKDQREDEVEREVQRQLAEARSKQDG